MRFFILALTVFLIVIAKPVYSQLPTDEEIAMHYYQAGEYDKALVKFEVLFNKNQQSDNYYSCYLNCLINLKEYKEAESLLKKLSKKYPNKADYFVDLGYIYKLEGIEKKKNSLYESILKNLNADEFSISSTANAFYKRDETDYAIQTLLKGRKLLSDPTAYAYTLADFYKVKGNFEELANEYFLLLTENPGELEIIEDKLQDLVVDDKSYEKLRELILIKVQASNYQIEYVNLFTWLLVQRNDFAEAFRQQKALDKRYGNNNVGLFQLAQISIRNHVYDIAIEIYQYILDKGQNTPYFYQAKFGLLDVQYYQISEKPDPTKEEILGLEKSYTDYLNHDFNKYIEVSEKLIPRLAEIKAIYLNNVDEAISLLEKYINVSQINNNSKAKMKIQLGDYYVLKGDVWEATLKYAQVDKMYPDNPIGHEAKYRNARLSFYKGEFEWATDQLDVLKASTSELIANDALQLSLLIQDNQPNDSTDISLEMYARADFFVFKNRFDSANVIFDSILHQYPNSTLADDIFYEKGQIELKKRNYADALKNFEKVYTAYPSEILADDAIYNAAVLCETYLNQKLKAQQLYEKIILDHPGSIYVNDSRIKFRKLRGDVVN
jgi:tetratricopeptide (TPR) repeat protein